LAQCDHAPCRSSVGLTVEEDTLANLFDHLPVQSRDEELVELLSRKGIRIERIVSMGQSTPEDAPYNQDHDEWILLLKGAARLWIEGQEEQDLRPGDHLLIPARHLHRETWTAPGEPTVWLAVHFPP
jgi:cupin 2 domain-containing protein